MKYLFTLWLIFGIHVRQSFNHRLSAIMTVLTWSLRTGLTIMLYAAIYKLLGKETIRSITYEVAASSMLFNAVFNGFSSRDIAFQINDETRSGQLEIWLNKPLSYIGLKATEVTGRGVPAVLGLTAVALLFWICGHGFPDIDAPVVRILAGILLFVLGLLIAICLYAMAGLTAVFLQDARPVNQLIDKAIMVFSGGYIPLGFFPYWFRLVGEILPTGAAVYMVQMFYPDFLTNLPRFLLTQLVWLVLCIWGLIVMQRKANRHMTVNGG